MNEPLDLVIRGSDHQNFVDIYLIACKALLSRPSMLGPALDAARTIQAIDEILPAYFEGIAARQDQDRKSKENKEEKERYDEEKTATGTVVHVEEVDLVNMPTTTRTASSTTTPTTTTTTAINPAVQTLLDICLKSPHITTKTHRLSPTTVEFIRANVAHVSQLPEGYADYKAFERVQKHLSDHSTTGTSTEN